jgi:hypothetical protein
VSLRDALIHRYSFDGTGTTATDSVGSANGTLVGATQSGGELTLDGTGYVDLPNGMISALSDATFEAWFTHAGSVGWERVFDFGESDEGEDAQGFGTSYIFYTPNNGEVARAAFLIPDGTEIQASAMGVIGTVGSIAVVFDAGAGQMSYYQNGSLIEAAAVTGTLGDINDVNNWLGRSQFVADPGLVGTITEFRIYDEALSSAQLSYSYDAHTDPAWLE